MIEALQKMQHSLTARTLFGEKFVTGYCAVKALELASFQSEISAWERRFLLPQV
jgi:glutamine synthetase